MSVNLYRLYSVQSFDKKRVAVYVNEGNYPDGEILTGAMNVVNRELTKKEVTEKYSYYFYTAQRKNKLNYFSRVLSHSKKILLKQIDVKYAIFVNSTAPKDWRGKRSLYLNNSLDLFKSDTPEYSGCTLVGELNL